MASQKSHRVVFKIIPAPPFTSYVSARRAIKWVCDEASAMQGAGHPDDIDGLREEIEHIRQGLYQLAKVVQKPRKHSKRAIAARRRRKA